MAYQALGTSMVQNTLAQGPQAVAQAIGFRRKKRPSPVFYDYSKMDPLSASSSVFRDAAQGAPQQMENSKEMMMRAKTSGGMSQAQQAQPQQQGWMSGTTDPRAGLMDQQGKAAFDPTLGAISGRRLKVFGK